MKNIFLLFFLVVCSLSCFRPEVRIQTKKEKAIAKTKELVVKENAICDIPINIKENFTVEESERGKLPVYKGRGIWFKIGSYSLDKIDLQIIKDTLDFLEINTNIILVIEGHADERGSNAKEKNQVLSENRAYAVLDALVDLGADINNFVVFGYSDKLPRYYENNTFKNRRVEFIAVKCRRDLEAYYNYRNSFSNASFEI